MSHVLFIESAIKIELKASTVNLQGDDEKNVSARTSATPNTLNNRVHFSIDQKNRATLLYECSIPTKASATDEEPSPRVLNVRIEPHRNILRQ